MNIRKTATLALVACTTGLLSGGGPQMTFADRCASDGFTPGTDPYLHCIGDPRQPPLAIAAQYQQTLAAFQRPTLHCTSYGAGGGYVSTTCR